MVAYQCATPAGGCLPEYAVRRKIEQQVAKAAHEHLIIFINAAQTTQIWQWVKREPGKPAACREHRFDKSQSGESLLQKLESIAFNLDEEETLVLTDVTSGVRAGFDIEKVTKAFYRDFDTHRVAFLKFIEGIGELADREAGIKFPMFLTRAVFDNYVAVPNGVADQNESGRLWDLVWMTRFAILRARPGVDRIAVALYVRNDNHAAKLVKLIATCGLLDIDDPQPAITLMMAGED